MRLRVAMAGAVLCWGLGGCAARPPRVVVPALGDGLEAFLRARPPAPDQGIRVDEVARTGALSLHVVQARVPERPHRHRRHDLAVTVLRGDGTMHGEDGPVAMRAGDVAFVPRGQVHWFAPAGDDAVALVVFAPPYDGADNEPLGAASR